MELATARLLLRGWRAEDLPAFAAMNADPEVMKHFPSALSASESARLLNRWRRDLEQQGYGLWALELPGEAPLAGFVGLMQVGPSLPFAPAVEVGWRLARPYWGRGLATEAAQAVIDFALVELALPEVLAYTAASNTRSRRVMERLGMTRDPAEDFAHPGVPAGHPLREHVLYRIRLSRSEAYPQGRVRALHEHRGA